MQPYWVLLLLCVLPAIIYRRREKFAYAVVPGALSAASPGPQMTLVRQPPRVTSDLILAAVVITLFVGLRYEVGTDWENYDRLHRAILRMDLFKAIGVIDPAFGLLNWISSRFTTELWIVNLVCAAIFSWGLVTLCSRLANPWLALTVAVPYLVIVVAIGYTRQGAAIGLCLIAITAIIDRSFVKFALFVLAATLFHRTAIVVLPLIALSYGKGKISTLLFAAVTVVAGYFFIVAPAVDEYIVRYGNANLDSSGTLVRLVMNMVPAVIFILFSRRFEVDAEERRLWLNLSWTAVLMMIVLPYVEATTALDRLALYIAPLQLVAMAGFPELFEARWRPLLRMLVIMYSITVQVVWLLFASNAEDWFPFQIYLPL
jgi:hypothetical protein